MRIYQDQDFEVTELKGKEISRFLTCRDSHDSDNILMIGIITKDNECYHCFLDAGISFIEKVETLEEDDELIYEDIAIKYELKEKSIKRVYSKPDEANSKIVFEIDTHTFVLQCLDPSTFDDEEMVFKKV